MNYKIQIIRDLSVIAVIIIHTLPNNSFRIVIRPLVNFAVPVFIFLSGYLTNISISKSPLKKRIIRVFIPYTVWSIIYTFYHQTWDDFTLNFLTANC